MTHTITDTKQFGSGSLDCEDGTRIDVHIANNFGRGIDDVTLTRVSMTVERLLFSRQYAAEKIIARTQTGGWYGKWQLDSHVREALGLPQRETE